MIEVTLIIKTDDRHVTVPFKIQHLDDISRPLEMATIAAVDRIKSEVTA
jgi:hypothetical protein